MNEKEPAHISYAFEHEKYGVEKAIAEQLLHIFIGAKVTEIVAEKVFNYEQIKNITEPVYTSALIFGLVTSIGLGAKMVIEHINDKEPEIVDNNITNATHNGLVSEKIYKQLA